MTLDEAQAIIDAMDRESHAPFSPKEREAVIAITLAWKMGEISMSECRGRLHLPPEEEPS